MLRRAKRRVRALLHALPFSLFRAYFFLPRVSLLRLALACLIQAACVLALKRNGSLDA